MITVSVLQLIEIILISVVVGGVAIIGLALSICEYFVDKSSAKREMLGTDKG